MYMVNLTNIESLRLNQIMKVSETNIQLYNQATAAGWLEESLKMLRDEYELAYKLLSIAASPS
jgi:hypothetical protein